MEVSGQSEIVDVQESCISSWLGASIIQRHSCSSISEKVSIVIYVLEIGDWSKNMSLRHLNKIQNTCTWTISFYQSSILDCYPQKVFINFKNQIL